MDNSNLPKIVQYYQEYKAAIFTSSLTLGTFLFTMKTFVIQNLKKEVYDNQDYQERIYKRIKAGQKETYYGQLNSFRRLLFATILVAFLNAMLQITLGFIKTKGISILCFSTTAISWGLTIWCLFLVTLNLSEMIKINEHLTMTRFKKQLESDSE
jgi:hypothetical protein